MSTNIPDDHENQLGTRRAFAVTGIDRSDYMVRDICRAIAFYRDVLGMEPASIGTNGCEYELADGSTFGLWHGGETVAFQPGNGVMFAVDDVDRARHDIRTAGHTIGIDETTAVCRFFTLDDSEGNTIALH